MPLSCLAQGQGMAMVWELEAEGERTVGLECGGTYDVWRIVAKGVSFPRFKHRVTRGVWGELDGSIFGWEDRPGYMGQGHWEAREPAVWRTGQWDCTLPFSL